MQTETSQTLTDPWVCLPLKVLLVGGAWHALGSLGQAAAFPARGGAQRAQRAPLAERLLTQQHALGIPVPGQAHRHLDACAPLSADMPVRRKFSLTVMQACWDDLRCSTMEDSQCREPPKIRAKRDV